MIEINLLPQELRIKKIGPGLTPENLILVIPLIFAVLIAVHIYLGVAYLSGGYQLGQLNKKWKASEPQRRIVESANKEYAGLTQNEAAVQQILKERVVWAEKLNLLSIDLPTGTWFNEITVSGKDFTIKGSVFSPTKQDFAQINKFLGTLTDDKKFFSGFLSLQLGPVQKNPVGSYDVSDFTISGKLQ
jgi:Tfp pilus assembly protein PilN